MKSMHYVIVALVAVVLAGCATGGGPGARSDQAQADLASDAASLLQRQMSFPPGDRIPQELVASARCIAVFPAVVEGGLIIGGRRGKGLVSCRQPSSSWSNAAPAIYTITGASVGLQAGAQKSSVILLFMTQNSTQSLLQGGVKLGAGLAVTAGPLGFNADVARAPSPVLAYVTSKAGLFAGVKLSGSQLSFSGSANARLYDETATLQDILFGETAVPYSMTVYVQTLQEYASNSMP